MEMATSQCNCDHSRDKKGLPGYLCCFNSTVSDFDA